VVWHHTVQERTGYFGRSIGVITFFVISGFLITRLLLRERDRRGTISVTGFWMRRGFRIFPLYYAVLGLYAVMVSSVEMGTREGLAFWRSLPYYASFTSNWFVDRSPGERVIFYFAWSLAVQEQFYLVWPLLLRRLHLRTAVLFPLAFLLAQDVIAWLGGMRSFGEGLASRIVASLDSPIFFGVLAAFALESERGFRLVHRIAGRRWSVPVAVVLVALPRWMPGVPQDVLALALTYLVLSCVLAPAGSAPVVENAVARHVGAVSYGIYLLHMLVINAVGHLLPVTGAALKFAVVLPVTVLVATASHRWFEQPIIRLGQRLRAPAGGLVTAAAVLPPAPALAAQRE